MFKAFLFSIIAIIVIVVAVAFFVARPGANDLALKGLQKKGYDNSALPQSGEVVNVTPRDEMIKLAEPIEDTVITSPLTIKGQARGAMFFEAVFPVELVAEDGQVLVRGQAQASSDWMTEDFVPFEVKLEFNPLEHSGAKLIVRKDNPSANPLFDRQFEWQFRLK